VHEHIQHTQNHHHAEIDALPDYKVGSLPHRAPLAVPFVPIQGENPPQYSPAEGLNRGTIFPGLDLPFHNQVNESNPNAGTLLGEIQGLGLALTDLHLYLDTHPHDRDVVRIFEEYSYQLAAHKKRYAAEYGPLTLADAVQDGTYSWLQDPWPWEYQERMV